MAELCLALPVPTLLMLHGPNITPGIKTTRPHQTVGFCYSNYSRVLDDWTNYSLAFLDVTLLCMHTHTNTHTHRHTHTCMYIYIYIYVHTHIQTCMHACMHAPKPFLKAPSSWNNLNNLKPPKRPQETLDSTLSLKAPMVCQGVLPTPAGEESLVQTRRQQGQALPGFWRSGFGELGFTVFGLRVLG